MVRRRNLHHPLASSPAPRWYVVRSMHGSVIESRPLVANADLTRLFVSAMLAWMDGGWRVGEFSSTSATFFCNRDNERRMVSIDPTDPHDVPMYGGAHFSGCEDASD